MIGKAAELGWASQFQISSSLFWTTWPTIWHNLATETNSKTNHPKLENIQGKVIQGINANFNFNVDFKQMYEVN